MKKLLHPKWLLLINTAPIALLFTLLIIQFLIIQSLFSEEHLWLCMIFTTCLTVMSLSTLSYAVVQWYRKKELSISYAIFSLLSHFAFLFYYCTSLSRMIPFDVPIWMLGDDIIVYVGTFLMPTMVHDLLIVVMRLTPSEKTHKIGYNFICTLSIPIFWYIFGQLILPFWKMIDYEFGIHTLIVLAMTSALVFLFFFVRTLYILVLQKQGFFIAYPLVWKIPITLILPVLGLLVNSGWIFSRKEFLDENSSLFGNFNSIWFYILAAVNGLLLCLPNSSPKLYRLLLFMGRSMCFAYTFYFLMVFLPFLPISVFLIVAVGIGFLMLTPLAVFVVHVNELFSDIRYLKQFLPVKLLYLITVLGFLVIPVSVTLNYMHDKLVLNEALNALYAPDYSKSEAIDQNSLAKTLCVINHHKDRTFDFLRSSQTPYLSAWFTWIVLDNMTLSDSKINFMEKIFLGHTSFDMQAEWRREDKKNVRLTNLQTHSVYNSSTHNWVSTIDLELTNASHEKEQQEYSTQIELPNGCWISNYYLYVGEKKEQGLLTEKKTARWIYTQIRNTRRDPGILYYLSGNQVAFKVFPFAENEVRKTGIEFIHKEPVTFQIDEQTVSLGDPKTGKQDIHAHVDDKVHYVSAAEKEKLKVVERIPYYHFIVDVSTGKEKNKNKFIQQIEKTLADRFLLTSNDKISFTNSHVQTRLLQPGWQEKLKAYPCEGGFYMERAVQMILFDQYIHPKNTYPIIVVVTDSLSNALLSKDFKDFKFTYPECEWFYELNEVAGLIPHSLFQDPMAIASDPSTFPFDHRKVLVWPNEKNPIAYLPNDQQPSFVLKKLCLESKENKSWEEKNWNAGLYMQGERMSQTLYPSLAEDRWLNLIRESFQTKIMTPCTSYLVVETESQKKMILKKQEQVLSGNQSLDLLNEPQRMSEPELLVVVIFFVCYLLYKECKRRKFIFTKA